MSLLMDALKKAEEAKEQATTQSSNEEHYALSDNGKEEIAKSEKMLDDLSLLHESALNLQEKSIVKSEPAESGLSLEPKEVENSAINVTDHVAVADTAESVPPSAVEPSTTCQSESAKLVQEIRSEKQPRDLTDSSLGVPKALSNNPSTVSEKVNTQRTFNVSPKRSARQPIVNIVFGLALFSIVGGIGYYYYSGTVSDLQQVSVPFPTQSVELDTEIATDELTVNEEFTEIKQDETSELSVADEVAVNVVAAAPRVSVEKNEVPDKPDNTVKPVNLKPKVSQSVPSKPAFSKPKNVIKPKPVSTPKQAAKPVTAQKPLLNIKPATKIPANVQGHESMNIVKQEMDDPILTQLEKAYDLYQVGNFQHAKQAYQNVLSKESGNRDARLGLAAIAFQNGELAQAHRHYKYLLRINPKDSIALSGVMSAITGANALKSESQIKLLLDQEPQAAHLHFTLGNLMSAQSRWSDAQQAYFQAYHFDPGNADYAFNLAVSLDYLGQQKSAINYYKKSLALSKNRNVNFSANTVVKRINSLSGNNVKN